MGAVRFSIDSGLVRELDGEAAAQGVRRDRYLRGRLRAGDAAASSRSCTRSSSRPPSTPRGRGSSRRTPPCTCTTGVRRRCSRRSSQAPARSVLYWLDAHWCDETSAGEETQCPLLEELEAIGSISDRSVVLIDDARLFMAPPPKPAVTEGWPQFSEVLDRLSALNSDHELLVIDDVLVFFPPLVREQLRDYAHHHAVDWLSELQVSAQRPAAPGGTEGRAGQHPDAKSTEQMPRAHGSRLSPRSAIWRRRSTGLEQKVAGLGEQSQESQAALEERLAPLTSELALERLAAEAGSSRRSRGSERSSASRRPSLGEQLEDVAEHPRTRARNRGSSLCGGLSGRLQVIIERLNELSQDRLEPGTSPSSSARWASGWPRWTSASSRSPFDQSSALSSLRARRRSPSPSAGQSLEPLGELDELADLRPARRRSRRSRGSTARIDQASSRCVELAEIAAPSSRRAGDARRAARRCAAPARRAAARSSTSASSRSGAQLDQRVEMLGDQLAELEAALSILRERSSKSLTALEELPEARGEIASLGQRVDQFGAELDRLRPSSRPDPEACRRPARRRRSRS